MTTAPEFPDDRPAKTPSDGKIALEFPSDARRRPRREEHFVLEDLPPRDRMLWGSIAYVFFPAALYRARWDPFVRFHIRQAWGLAVLWVFFWWLAGRAYVYESPELGAVPVITLTILWCTGIHRALSLEKRGVFGLGRLLDKLPLPKKLAE